MSEGHRKGGGGGHRRRLEGRTRMNEGHRKEGGRLCRRLERQARANEGHGKGKAGGTGLESDLQTGSIGCLRGRQGCMEST